MEIMKIVYVAELAHDIDDVVACIYLHLAGVLECVVLDGTSRDFEREKQLIEYGITMVDNIPQGAKIVACGGQLTKVSQYLENNKLDFLVFNGCFAGSNIVPKEYILPKFAGRVSCRSWNPNLDIPATLSAINSPNCGHVVLVSKNVCHHPNNVRGKWHKDEFLVNMQMKDEKRLHDLLMVKEAQSILEKTKSNISYYPVRIHLDDAGNKWSASFDPNSKISISIAYIE